MKINNVQLDKTLEDVNRYISIDFYDRILEYRLKANPKHKKSNEAIEKAMFLAEVCIVLMRKVANENRND